MSLEKLSRERLRADEIENKKLKARRKLTIRDIAKRAKVSPMTVSRVLNDHTGVREETRNRVLDLVRTLNYRPDPTARSLASGKSNLIGLVVANISNPFYAELARGIEDKAHEMGYNVIFCSTDNKPERLETYVDLMMKADIEGFIFSSA